MQQSFEKAFLHLQQFEGHSSFSTWLTRIAMNEALMWVPKRGSRVEMPLEQSSADDGATQPLDFPESTPNPEDRCAPLAIQRKTARGANQMELKIAGFCGETTGRQTHRSDDHLEGHLTNRQCSR